MFTPQDACHPADHPPGLARRLPRRTLLGVLGSLLCPTFVPEAEAARFTTVVLDPGHGGHDNGAKWGGIPEKKLTLDVAKRVETLLKKKGIRTVLTRTTDKFVTLDGRAAISNRYRSPIFVSIHFNAHWNRSIKGIETFYMSSAGRSLASRIQGRLMARIRTTNRGIKSKSFAVLRKTRGTAVLVECSFLSNSWERQRCASSWYRQLVAQSIYEGIVAYR